MSNESIAPFVLLRISGGDIERVTQMNQEEAARNIEEILDIEKDLHEIKSDLDEALFQIVSTFTDDEQTLSNLTLKVKRNIFNDRPMTLSEDVFAELEKRLPEAAYQQLGRWYSHIHKRASLMKETKDIFEKEVHSASRILAAEMGQAEWQKGLAIANPSYLHAYRKDKRKLWHPHKQYARSSMSYLSRITMKTSPFSTFTKLGMTSFESQEAHVTEEADTGTDNFCHLTKALSCELVFEMAKNSAYQSLFQYERNTSIQWLDRTTIQYVTGHYSIANGFAWRSDTLQTIALSETHLQFLSLFETGGFDEVTDMTSIPFLELIDMQLIKPILPFSRKTEHPLNILSDLLVRTSAPAAENLSALIKHINDSVYLMGYSDGTIRIQCQKSIYDYTRQLFNLVTSSQINQVLDNSLVYENVRNDIAHPPLGDLVKQDLKQLATHMRNHLFITHVYDVLVDHFAERYGQGGICTDVRDFLYSFENRKDRARLMKRALKKDKQQARALLHDRIYTPMGESTAPPHITLFYQLAAVHGWQDIQKGHYKMVLNQSLSGGSGLFLRYQTMFPENKGDLKSHMQDWLGGMYQDAEVVNLPIVGEYNNLQSDFDVTMRSLRVGGEPSNCVERHDDYELSDLRLVLRDNHLVLLNQQGVPIAPIYTGSVPQHMHYGIHSTLLTIAMPWVNAFDSDGASPFAEKFIPPQHVDYHPRVEHGRIVIKRAKWVIPHYLFPVKSHKESPFNYFTRLKTFQRQHQLPNEGYLANAQGKMALEAKKRKPLYFNFNHYHSIEAAVQTVLDGGPAFLSLTEALPDQHTHWLKDAAGKTYTTEYMSLIHWEMAKAHISPLTASHINTHS